MSARLSEQEIQRRDALQKLREAGIDPYPAALYPVADYSVDLKKDYEEGKKVVIAGRLMRKKVQGKASFGMIQDSKGKIQVYFNRDEICPGEDKSLYNDVFKKLLDLGDFIGIKGEVFKTQVGEITVKVEEFTILSKSLKPLPVVKTDEQGNVHDAFTDPEQRYRMRYVDLIVNDHVRETFLKRTRLMNAMREFFNQKGYLE
ncbi:MAG TPA: lysine--tRNA ligase, partial [Cryomorphaceae bacterium]|nr:lysine--tRNA ligase [Cryomorphaceae bacterium]